MYLFRKFRMFVAVLVVSTPLAACSSSSPISVTNSDYCEFMWFGPGTFWGFKSAFGLESADGKSHIVDIEWEATDESGEDILGRGEESGIRINPSKGLLVADSARPDIGIDINSDEFQKRQEEAKFKCAITKMVVDESD